MSPLSWRQWIKNCVAARKLPRANVSRKRRQTRVLLTLEGLEDRITPSNVSWTGADNNLSWSDGKNWSNGLVPTSSDDVTISKTVNGTIGIGAGSYAVHSLNDTTAALSIASGGTLSLAAAAATSTFDYNVTVNSGGTLSVGAGAKVNIGSGATLSDDGTLTFGSGATATFNPLLGASQIVVDNDGLMSASGATFDASNNLSISQIVVKLGELKASNCNFTISKVDLTDSSVVKSGDLTGNTFNTTLYTPIADVPLLTNNQSFDNVDINPGDSLSSGQTVTLTLMGTQSHANLVYVLAGNLTIKTGATLTVAANVSLDIGAGTLLSSLTLTDDGLLTFASGDTVTFNNLGLAQIVVGTGGEMKANDTVFNNASTLSPGQIVLTDGSVVKTNDLTNNIFNVSLYTPIGDVKFLTNNQSFDDVYINAGDSLSSGQSATLTLMGTQSHANLLYLLAGNFTIKMGATLAVAANVSLDIGAGTLLSSLTLTDDGLLTFASGDTVTFNNLGLAQIVVGTGGEMKANDTVFNNASTLSPGQIVLTDGSVVKTNDLTNNIFNVSLYTPIGDVKFLTNNQSFDDVYINAGDSLSSGQSATLTAMGTVSSANLVYILAGDFTIKTGATLTVGANVSLDIGMPSDLSLVTLTDDGLLTFASGDTVTFSNLGPSQIVVGTGGEMKANGTVFNNANSLSTSQIVVQSGGQLVATGSNITVTNLSNAGSVNLTNSTLTVSGTVSQLSGTSLTAGTWIIAAGSSLDLASTVNITTLTGANVTLSGASSNFAALANLDSISASSSFSLLAGLNFTTAGDLSNAGTVTVVGDTLKVTGNLSNTGAINLSSGTLSVAGSVAQLSSSHALTAGRWTVGPHSNLNFASGSSITSLAGSQVTLNGATSNFAALASLNTIAAGSIFSLLGGRSFTTAGDLSSAGGIILNTATLNVSGNLTNTGGLIWTNATVNVAGNLSNTGRLNLNGSTLTVKGTVAQLSANALTAGTWNIGPSSNLNFAAGSKITSLAGAQVTLNGATSNFAALASLNTIAKGSSLSLLGGRSFTTAGNFTNNGSLTIGAGSVLTASGSFSQASTASLSVQLGGSNSAPTIGRVVSTTGTVTLGGTLHLTSTVVPAVGTSFEVLANEGGSAISGTFAGLAEGGTFLVTSGSTTMTFQISYKGDGGNNVTITRIS